MVTGDIDTGRSLLAALAHCQRTILRAPSEEVLLAEICRIIVEEAGVDMAWIGFADAGPDKLVRAAAHAGIARDYLERTRITWGDDEQGRGPTGTAIRTGEPQIVRSLATAPQYLPWRDIAMEYGFVASAAFPLQVDSRPFGAISVYVTSAEKLTSELITQLRAFAIDLSYGITLRRTQEDRLRVALSNLEIAAFAQDTSLRYTWIYRSQLGYRSEDVIGRRDDELLPAAAARATTELKRRALEEGVHVRGEVDVETAAGEQFTFEVAVEPDRDVRGDIVGVIGASLNISERKRAERALRDSRDRLARTLDKVSTFVALCDPQGVVLEVNEAPLAIAGIRREEVVGKYCADTPYFAHEASSRARFTDALARAQRGESVRCELAVHVGEGRHLVVDSRFEPILGAHGEVLEIVVSGTDVTALRDVEQRAAALVENTLDLIAILGDDGEVKLVSPSALAIGGYQPSELVGRSMLELVHPDDAFSVRTALAAIVHRPGASQLVRLRLRHADGTYRTLDAAARNLKHVQAIAGILVNCRDVTEQLVAEQRLRHAEKLEAIGTLAGGVAHDFNNLLSIVFANGEILREDARSATDREMLDEIVAAAKRARDLTSKLLAFSRKSTPQREAVDVNMIVAEVLGLLARTLDRRIMIDDRRTATALIVQGDATAIQSAVLNLAVNARDAMPAGGRLTIGTRRLSIARDDSTDWADPITPGPHVEISVSDTGAGITQEISERLYEPFFTTKSAERGTGLGLAAARGCAASHGGSISFTTTLGQGTTFRLLFPAAPAETKHIAWLDPAPIRGSGRVMIVDDDENVRKVLCRQLARLGYSPHVVGDTDAALQLLECFPHAYDAVLLDINMPERSGLDVLAAVREIAPAFPVILCSGHASGAVADILHSDRSTTFLAKPFSVSDLSRALAAILETNLAVAAR